ncbi:hypothetical protein [Serratia odorifera]|nr:hypothetical protein [Serratia odorifera]RII74088.1 hypothetical protein DX901_00370 [Serratia odorifera]
MLAIPYPTAASGMYGAYDLTLTFRTTPYGVGLGYMEISAKCDHSFCLGVHIEDRGRNASGVLTGGRDTFASQLLNERLWLSPLTGNAPDLPPPEEAGA